MKTTIDIADALLEEAKARARMEGTTLRAVVERSLRRELADDPGAGRPLPVWPTFALTPAPGVDPSDWKAIEDIIYEPRHGYGDR